MTNKDEKIDKLRQQITSMMNLKHEIDSADRTDMCAFMLDLLDILCSEGQTPCDHKDKGGHFFDADNNAHCMNCGEIDGSV